jgi:hypothetical protein
MILLLVRPRSTGGEEKNGSRDRFCFLLIRFPLTISFFRVFKAVDLGDVEVFTVTPFLESILPRYKGNVKDYEMLVPGTIGKE